MVPDSQGSLSFLFSLAHSPADIMHSSLTFGHVPAYAPGRVNLIGDHTDYNDGFLLFPPLCPSSTRARARAHAHTQTHTTAYIFLTVSRSLLSYVSPATSHYSFFATPVHA
jgi:hypothetical protein